VAAVIRGSASYAEVFASGEFRALFAAQLMSVAGDQLARVALSVLVYDRTGSAGLTALTYALTFLPDLLGGPLLSGFADRHPRRRVMIVSDLLRAALVAGMALPGLSLPAVVALLVGVQLLSAPGGAARAALLPQVLDGRRYVVGAAVLNMTGQSAQIVGFAFGGVLVAAVGTGGALLLDAGTFLASGLLVLCWVRRRPASTADGRGHRWWRSVAAGGAMVWTDRRLRALVALACVSGFYIAGEALAAPYAGEVGGGAAAVGLLLAAYPGGTVLGMAVVARLPDAARLRLMAPMALLACAPLTLCALRPGLVVTLVLWTCSGAASACHLTASTTFVRSVPDERRGQAFGLAVTALRVSQGLGVLLAGVAAEAVAASTVVAGAGGLGILAATGAARAWYASQQPRRPRRPDRDASARLADDLLTAPVVGTAGAPVVGTAGAVGTGDHGGSPERV